jgi:hypothetical protein
MEENALSKQVLTVEEGHGRYWKKRLVFFSQSQENPFMLFRSVSYFCFLQNLFRNDAAKM